MSRIRTTFTVALLIAGSTALAQDQRGPAIGSTIKNFALSDQSGETREWKTFLGKGPVALVVYRSADW